MSPSSTPPADRRPTDEEIRTLLSGLPRPEPPAGFTDAVMARVRRENRRRRFPWLAVAAGAAILAVALLLGPAGGGPADEPPPATAANAGGAGPSEPPEPPRLAAERAEFEALREETRRLAEQLELLRQFTGEVPARGLPAGSAAPLVRIGGTEEMDFFLDLQSFLEIPPGPEPGPTVIPASSRGRRR